MEPVCKICLEQYNSILKIPRVCNSCGRSICEKCLNDIFRSIKKYQCSFCRYSSMTVWPKNLQLVEGLEHQGIICNQHKRKILTLCCSQSCSLPIGICDLPECSSVHKQKGTNVLPMSLLKQPLKNKAKQQHLSEIITGFNQQIMNQIQQILKRTTQSYFQQISLQSESKLSEKSKKIIKLISQNKIGQIDSKTVNELKSEILTIDEQKQNRLSMQNNFKAYKERVIKELIKRFDEIQLGNVKVLSKPVSKINVEQQQLFQFILKKLKQIKLQGKRTFKCLFDSKIQRHQQFKNKVEGLNSLLFIVEVNDGTIFGAYMNQKFKPSPKKAVEMSDKNSFFWNYSLREFYPPSLNSINFDFSSGFLLSVGNSGNFDGFWFENSFDFVNASTPSLTIWTKQFQNVKFEIRSKAIRQFRCFQIQH